MRALGLAAALLALPLLASTAGLRYQVTQLGVLDSEADFVFAQAINTDGYIAGYADTRHGERAFIRPPEGGLHDLGIPGETRARALNGALQVTGSLRPVDAFRRDRAYLWHPRDGTRPLSDTLSPEDSFRGRGINDHGQVVGSISTGGRTRAFVWSERDGLRDIGTAIAPEADSHALAIDNRGRIAGYFSAEGGNHGFVRQPDGTLEILGGPGQNSIAAGVNDAGAVVGRLDDEAFIRHPGGELQTLGFLDPDQRFSEAMAVAQDGMVIGRSITDDGMRAFLWTPDQGMQQLDTLIGMAGKRRTRLFAAVAVNDRGQIITHGLPAGERRVRSMLLEPLED